YFSIGYDKEPPLAALKKLAPDKVCGALLSAFDSRDNQVREWAAKRLREDGDVSAVPALVKRVSLEEPERYFSIGYDKEPPLAALRKLAPEQVEAALKAALASNDQQVR